MKRPIGVVFYQGPSAIDGRPIVAIATFKSKNRKTGDMIQTWIMPADEHPNDSLKTGGDASVCGDCVHRPAVRQAAKAVGRNVVHAPCYVAVGRAPSRVWEAWKRGTYSTDLEACGSYFAGRKLRLGAWGDPAAVPFDAWRPLLFWADDWAGYTHRAGKPEAARLKGVVMASADSQGEARKLQRQGWATFRIAPRGNTTRLQGEARCPASAEAGARVTCTDCPLACDGQARGRVVGRVIQAH